MHGYFFLLVIQLTELPYRHTKPTRKDESLPIADAFRNAVPTISFKLNSKGITLLWNKKPRALTGSVENYQIIVDNEPYGALIAPDDESKLQINLLPGKHECYLRVIPKDKDGEVYKSNVLKLDVLSIVGLKNEPPSTPSQSVLEEKDVPLPKLNVRTIDGSSIRVNWYLDRPMPTGTFAAMYDVHIRGQDFPEQMSSDECSRQGDYTEHIWHVSISPFEISGIPEGQDYTIFIRAFLHAQESSDTKYLITISNEVPTSRGRSLIDLLTRPLIKVTRIGIQMANISWKLDESIDQSLVKGYRVILNSKPTEILSPDQNEYELRNLKPGTTNEIQVSVTSHPDFVDEKISEPIRIVCPQRPEPVTIESIKADKPFSIAIKWKLNRNEQDEITSFKVFLNGKLHEEIETNGRQSFKYEFTKLHADKAYAIYIKSLIGQKRLDGYVYQCDIESIVSNELVLKCAAPPTGTTPRIERMHWNGVDIIWDAPVESDNVKLTGYQILRNGKAIGKLIPLDKRRASINDLKVGNRYSFQVVPITDQPGGILFQPGEEYDPNRHGHYLPGPKLEVEFTDLIQSPTKIWVEKISGYSAIICWSSIDESFNSNVQPDGYKLSIWDNKDLTRDKPRIVPVAKDINSTPLKDLQSATTYEIQLETFKKRRHQTTNELYTVLATSEILTLHTGSPPSPPANLFIIACTNTAVRIGFDPFIEHNAEIKIIRVQYEPVPSQKNIKEIVIDVMPDATEFTLTNLIERTDYNVTIHGITEEYLIENHFRDVSQLPRKLKTSEWLANTSLEFTTSGCEPAREIKIHGATNESIQLEWKLPKAYGSTRYFSQILRWKLEQGGEERSMELNQDVTSATIPGILPSGLYQISLDSIFSIKINLEEDADESGRKEIRFTTTESATVRFRMPSTCERPEIYLTGYTTNTIDLTWNKPNVFNIIDHPEKINEQLKIHCRLLGYKIDIDGRTQNTLDEDQCRCTLTECQPGTEYKVQLIALSTIQNEYENNMITNNKENIEKPDETPSKRLRIQMLKAKDILRSFHTNFEFNHQDVSTGNTAEVKSLGKVNANWTVTETTNISHFILQWRSSKDLRIQQKTVASNETSSTIDSCDVRYYYVIELIIVNNDGTRNEYKELTIPIPGEPDAPKLWLVKTTDTSFSIEWSEPKSYGIPIIGFQLFIEGKKRGDMVEANLRHAEIPSRINRTYQVNVCAITNNPQCPRSLMSQTLSVITSPTSNLIPTMYYNNDDGSPTSFDRSVARIIPLQIESVNEEKLHIDWTSFLPTKEIRAYYIHYTCLNSGEVQAMKVSKRFRQAVLRGLRPGFTYGIMVMAVDKNGGVLYTSDKSTVQMSAPPNAPIVAIKERENNHVKFGWCPAASYGEVQVVGYKIFVNNRLAAVLSHDQLTYTLTNGIPCDIYTVHVQALSSEKTIVSPMSRGIQFSWPGIKPGSFRRIDDGQTETIIVAWEHPQLEDENEKLLGFKLFSENIATHAFRLHGEYDAATHQATIHDLHNGKYRLWLEIQSECYCIRARPITIMSGRLNSLPNRQISFDAAQSVLKKQKRFRSPVRSTFTPPLRHVQ